MKGFLLVQGEVYRYVVVNSHGNTVLFTGVPAREALYHAHGFAVEQFVYATDYRNVSYITVFVYNEAHGNAAFDASFNGHGGIFYMVADVFHQGLFATGESGHLFYDDVDLFFFDFGGNEIFEVGDVLAVDFVVTFYVGDRDGYITTGGQFVLRLDFVLFTYLFDPSSAGFLNTILEGLGMEPILWLDDPNLVIPLIVVTMTWRGAGSTALIYLSAFAGIDRSYYEAAQIDGAGVWSRIVHITLPQIVPSMTTLFVLQVISVMQVFYEPFVMTNGGGGDRSSLSLLLLAYNFGFRDGRVDLSSACTVVLFLIILALSAVYYLAVRLLKKRGYRV